MLYGQEVTLLAKTQMCMWYNTAGTRWGRMVVTRDPSGRLKDGAYFSTKLDASVEDVLAQYARRWELECAFRNAKQVMGLEDPQNGWWRRKNGKPKDTGAEGGDSFHGGGPRRLWSHCGVVLQPR